MSAHSSALWQQFLHPYNPIPSISQQLSCLHNPLGSQKFCKNSRCITWYSFIVNIIIGILFSLTFTNLNKYKILWVGLFGFIGADTIYRNLEGKLSSYSQLNKDDKNDDKKDNNSNSNKSNVDVDDVIGEIHYD